MTSPSKVVGFEPSSIALLTSTLKSCIIKPRLHIDLRRAFVLRKPTCFKAGCLGICLGVFDQRLGAPRPKLSPRSPAVLRPFRRWQTALPTAAYLNQKFTSGSLSRARKWLVMIWDQSLHVRSMSLSNCSGLRDVSSARTGAACPILIMNKVAKSRLRYHAKTWYCIGANTAASCCPGHSNVQPGKCPVGVVCAGQ